MISDQIIFEAIAAILAADSAFLLAFLAYISPKYQDYIVERRKSLDEKLKAEINEYKTNNITIEAFLPLFEEHEVIEDWGTTLKQILVQFGYSIFLVSVGLVIALVGYEVTINDIPVEVLFIIGGGLYFLVGLYSIIKYAIEVNEWRVSQKK